MRKEGNALFHLPVKADGDRRARRRRDFGGTARGLAALLIFLVFCACPAGAQERLLRMDVEAAVGEDALLTVTERIAFVAEGLEIRRGLIRNIPVVHEEDGRRVAGTFRLLSAALDGKAVPYTLKRAGRDVEIHLGDDRLLRPGEHEYVIRYTLTGQPMFHEDADELYWNVTGNEWIFPIESASFRLLLPAGAAVRERNVYTGFLGRKGSDWRAGTDGRIETTRTLQPGEGLTVSLAWDKGFVTAPPSAGFWEIRGPGRSRYLLCVALVVAGYAGIWAVWGRDPRRGTVIPLFSAPFGLDAGYIGYAKKLRFDENLLLSDLIQLAVRGQIRIEPQENFLSLEKVVDQWDPQLSSAHRALVEAVFSGGEKIVRLGGNPEGGVISAPELVRRMPEFYGTGTLWGGTGASQTPRLVRWNAGWCVAALLLFVPLLLAMAGMDSPLAPDIRGLGFWLYAVALPAGLIGVVGWLLRWAGRTYWVAKRSKKAFAYAASSILSFAVLVVYIGLSGPAWVVKSSLETYYAQDPLLLGGVWIALAAAGFFSFLMPARTRAGRVLLDQVEGFEMYLQAAEKHRFEILYPTFKDAVPEMTTELFERFLPYAFALDVVLSWTEAFTPLLSTASYSPGWYRGYRGMDTLSGDLFRARTAMRPPSSSAGGSTWRGGGGSGRGGGGFSGGGRGGGGGRGR